MTTLYSQVSEVPLALGVFLASDYYDHDHDPFTISATTLLKPVRQIVLPARIPPADSLVPLASMVKNRIGAAIHDGIERAWKTNHRRAMAAMGYPQHIIDRVVINPTKEFLRVNPSCIPVYLEQRLTRQVGRWKVTGKFDFVGEGKVQDFKSTTVWTYLNQVNNNKYTEQGSIYRWLDPELIYQDEMDIHYLFTDWKQAEAQRDATYPQAAFRRQVFQLHTLAQTDHMVRKKLALIEQYWNAPEDMIPDCSDEDLWRSEPVFKYYRNPLKTQRSTRNFDNKQDAYRMLADQGGQGIVKEVPGEVQACKYCPSAVICSQRQRLVAAGDLKVAA